MTFVGASVDAPDACANVIESDLCVDVMASDPGRLPGAKQSLDSQ
jgi:hypothetical protein